MADANAPKFLQVMRILSIALMASLAVVLMAVTAMIAQRGHPFTTVPYWAIGIVAAAAAAIGVLIQLYGYQYQPIAPGTQEEDARISSVRQLQTTTLIRFALAEVVALVGIAVGFAASEGGVYPLLFAVLVSEVLMALNVWPSARLIARVQQQLEREGGLSYLREAMDAPPPRRGA